MAELSFEDAYARLEEVIALLEAGHLDLSQSLKLYEEGIALADHCNRLLDEAELRVRQLQPTPEGGVEAVPFEGWETES
ncbi:MAG TPA: exodeoxyribonuclease VII small subunit [Anaerolineae bacterium]|nr:exodeoxyribonuclease VII small subunit [Anaerolineae bacterium]HIQ06149.1 exodeoxyribonuclease VII small subunit [Anaerolineae bacterium]